MYFKDVNGVQIIINEKTQKGARTAVFYTVEILQIMCYNSNIRGEKHVIIVKNHLEEGR